MTVDFENETGRDLGLDLFGLASLVVSRTLDELGCPYEAQASVLVTDDARIREINREQRGIDRPTDVLSFPMAEYALAGDFTFLEEDGEDCFDPDTGQLLLGDIVVSIDRVEAQAREYGHGVKREYAFLVAHSVLHLIGFDHMEAEEAEEMERKQEEILEKLGITR